jgi:hypothetical protein
VIVAVKSYHKGGRMGYKGGRYMDKNMLIRGIEERIR